APAGARSQQPSIEGRRRSCDPALTLLTQVRVKATKPNRAVDPTRNAAALNARSLATRLRLRDGRIDEGTITLERPGGCTAACCMHADSHSYVALAIGRRPSGGRLRITTRRDSGHSLPGRASGQ